MSAQKYRSVRGAFSFEKIIQMTVLWGPGNKDTGRIQGLFQALMLSVL